MSRKAHTAGKKRNTHHQRVPGESTSSALSNKTENKWRVSQLYKQVLLLVISARRGGERKAGGGGGGAFKSLQFARNGAAWKLLVIPRNKPRIPQPTGATNSKPRKDVVDEVTPRGRTSIVKTQKPQKFNLQR